MRFYELVSLILAGNKTNCEFPSEFKPQIIKIETESQFTELCQEEKHCSFDRNDQYLFRFYWIELTNDEHYVLISRPWGYLTDGRQVCSWGTCGSV